MKFSKRNGRGFLLFAHWLQHKAESWILSTVAEDLLVFVWTNRGKLGDSLGLVWVVVFGLVDWLGEDFISRVCAKQCVEKISRISKNPILLSRWLFVNDEGGWWVDCFRSLSRKLLKDMFLKFPPPQQRNTFLINNFLAYRSIYHIKKEVASSRENLTKLRHKMAT